MISLACPMSLDTAFGLKDSFNRSVQYVLRYRASGYPVNRFRQEAAYNTCNGTLCPCPAKCGTTDIAQILKPSLSAVSVFLIHLPFL